MFEYYANSTIAEVLREAGKFDLIHSRLSSAWIPLAGATGTPGLFTMHTRPHLDDAPAASPPPARCESPPADFSPLGLVMIGAMAAGRRWWRIAAAR